MKSRLLGALAASLMLFALVSCNSGGDGGGGDGPTITPLPPIQTPQPTPPSSTTGTIDGRVTNASTGGALANISISAGSLNATTDAQGNFTFTSVLPGDFVISIASDSFAMQSRQIAVIAGATTFVGVQMVPVAATTTFDPISAQQLTVPGSTAQVDLPADSLRTSGGTAATGQVTARLTPISPAVDAGLEPGNYVASLSGGGTAQIETYGGFDIRFRDAGGNVLTMAAGQLATIRIPLNTRSGTPPATVPLFYYNETTGRWIEEGTATLTGSAGSQYYQGTVSHFGHWTAAQTYTVSMITVCVNDTVGLAVSRIRVVSDGIDYSGTGDAVTNTQGVAVVPMKRSRQATIVASDRTRVSNTASISAAQSASDFTLTPCLVVPSSGISIKLTWGSSPSDLDSHLKGPNSMHVYWVSRGSLTSVPYAQLDVDDVTSYGPEVVTITRLARGAHRYFVHNWSDTFNPGMVGSPARIEVQFAGQTQIHSPPAGEGINRHWHVFDFTVANDCRVTITPVNGWSAAEPANPSGSASGTYCDTVQPTAVQLQHYADSVSRAQQAEQVRPSK